jgi:hypothetical protein
MKKRTFLLFAFLSLTVTFGVSAQGTNTNQTTNDPFLWAPAYEASVWKPIENPGENLGCRTISATLLEAVGSSGYPERTARIDDALEKLESMQDRDPASKTYGNFRWYWREQKPGDLNAVEFVTQRAVLLKLLYSDRLSPKGTEILDRILNHAVEGIHRQKVDVAYTNIFLMKAWNLLALGQALKRPDLTKEGALLLDEWIAFTQKNGITEYLSPTYLGIDLDSLSLMANELTDPLIKEKAEKALIFFWKTIAANWFEPAQRLGGPHGRDYDYLRGHGELDRNLIAAGWIPAPPRRKPQDNHVFESLTKWAPPAELRQQARNEAPRFVYQRCGTNDTDWASQWIGKSVGIGVAGTGKGAEDKPFAVNLAGPAGKETVMVNFFMDGRDDPYGSKKIATGASGHHKAHHLDPLFRAVQSGQDVLFLSTYPGSKPPSKKEVPPSCLYSHLDLPEEASVWSSEKPLDGSLPEQPLEGNLCFLRMGDAAVGIRFLLAEDITGKPIKAKLVTDGHQFHAKRLTVSHSVTPPGDGRGTVAVFARVAEGLDDAGFASFRSRFAAARCSADRRCSELHLDSEGSTNHLSLSADLVSGKILRSQGGDRAVQTAPLNLNGKAIDLSTP